MPPQQDQRARADPDDNSTTTTGAGDKPQETVPEPGLLPRLLHQVGRLEKAPADRNLYGELLKTSIGSTKTFVVGGYTVSAAHVWSVGAAVYFRSDAAGILRDLTAEAIAAECHVGERAIRAALSLYRDWNIIRTFRPGGRRAPAEHRINIGGLDWPAVRKRAAAERAEAKQARLELASRTAESGHHDRTRTTESGHHDRTRTTESGHHDRTRTTESGHHDRTRSALSTIVRTSQTHVRDVRTAAAAEYLGGRDRGAGDQPGRQQQQEDLLPPATTTPAATEPGPDNPDAGTKERLEQAEREQVRLEGLLAAIAGRTRDAGREFTDDEEQKLRRGFATGEIHLGDLQRKADDLKAALAAAPPTARPARPRGAVRRRFPGERPDLTDAEYVVWEASGRNPAAVQQYRDEQEGSDDGVAGGDEGTDDRQG